MNDLPNQLRGFLSALRADLAEKRLLPVVAVLAAAVIGIPIAYTVTASKSAPAPAVAAPTISGPGAALTAAPPAQPTQTHALGKLHDPFGGGASTPTAPKSNAAGPITARTGASGPAGPTANAPAPATGGSGTGTHTTPGSSPKPSLTFLAERQLRIYKVDYSFGQGASIKQYNDAVRLDAVPSNATPVVQFLGISKDTRKAAFLIWNGTNVSGDGGCINGQTPCQIVELKPGQTEFIDVAVTGAGIVQFELDMLAIHTSHAATHAQALQAHMRQSADGIKTLSQSTASALTRFEYSTLYGTLLPRATPGSGQPTGATGATGAASSSSRARPSGDLGTHVVHNAHGAR